jgi:uncharacterized protein (TIGR00661 family)
MQIINRCTHGPEITRNFDFQLAKLAVKAKLPGAWHYLISSFFFPPVRKLRTSLIPPILRPEILAAKQEPGAHILVYQTSSASTRLLPLLKKLPYEFRIYGMGREGEEGNLRLKTFSETGFVDDLRTARAVIAGGGYSLMGEAVHLHVPMLSVPIRSQYEQVLNALYLEELGYGRLAEDLTEDTVVSFLQDLPRHAEAISRWPRYDQSILYGCVDEILKDVQAAEGPKMFLNARSLGSWEAGSEAD